MDLIQHDIEVSRSHRNRQVAGLLFAAGVLVSAIISNRPGPPAENTIRIGQIQDFPIGSANSLTLNAVYFNPNPVYSTTEAGQAVVVGPIGRSSPLPVWVVNDQSAGLLVLLSRDPQSSCRITRPDHIHDALFVQRVEQAGAFFIDPCHGDMFSYTGNLLGGGPSGRGMDRFDVIIDADGIVVVNLKEFRNGSTRAP